MAATYDLSTDIGKVRLRTHDTDVTPSTDALFSDEEIQAFLTSEGTVLAAAAACLEALASNAARLAKMTRSLNYGKDTRGVSRELLAMAERYRATDMDAPAAGIAEQSVTPAVAGQIDDNHWAQNNG